MQTRNNPNLLNKQNQILKLSEHAVFQQGAFFFINESKMKKSWKLNSVVKTINTYLLYTKVCMYNKGQSIKRI